MAEAPTTIEQELEVLQKEYEAKRQNLESQKEMPHPKETLREVVGEKIQRPAPLGVAPPPATAPTPSMTPGAEPPSYLSPELKDKVQKLITEIFTVGLDKTIEEVRKINNPALTEAFHGALVDELYPELLKRGIIKEIK